MSYLELVTQFGLLRTNTRTQTQLTTVTYVSTQPTTLVSTYVSTQPASTNTATITQRTTVVSTYQTTSVFTQTQTSTAPGQSEPPRPLRYACAGEVSRNPT